MKFFFLLRKRLAQYYMKNKVIFLLFVLGGALNAIVFCFSYGNLLPAMSNRNSQEIQYREYFVRYFDGVKSLEEKETALEVIQNILSARCCIVIQLKNVCKTYRAGPNQFQALHAVDLTIEKGEFVSICGPSGSGKTTLLNMIGCLDTFEAGQYLLNGTDVTKMRDKKRANLRNAYIGFVLQDFALINAQTVLYNVMLPLLFSKRPYREIKKKALNALNSVHILDQAHKKVNQLSGGQRQRVAIARAIVNHPEIILADEPTGQLDSETSRQIMELLTELNQKGITVVVVTHDPIVAATASRKITVIDGRITSDTVDVPQ